LTVFGVKQLAVASRAVAKSKWLLQNVQYKIDFLSNPFPDDFRRPQYTSLKLF
jgi:hypothetical protein